MPPIENLQRVPQVALDRLLHQGLFTTDLGYKAVASDLPLEDRARLLDYEDAELASQSEEHGVFRLAGELPAVGDYLLAVKGIDPGLEEQTMALYVWHALLRMGRGETPGVREAVAAAVEHAVAGVAAHRDVHAAGLAAVLDGVRQQVAQDALDGHEAVARLLCDLLGLVQHLGRLRIEVDLPRVALHLRQFGKVGRQGLGVAVNRSSRSAPEASDMATSPRTAPTPLAPCLPVRRTAIPSRKLPSSENFRSLRTSFR